MRASFNGRTLASQANNVGSIPIARSSFSSQKALSGLFCFRVMPDETVGLSCRAHPEKKKPPGGGLLVQKKQLRTHPRCIPLLEVGSATAFAVLPRGSVGRAAES